MADETNTMLKITVLHYRDQSHDEATWMRWWNEEHMPCIMPIAIKHGIERVELVRLISFPQLTSTLFS